MSERSGASGAAGRQDPETRRNPARAAAAPPVSGPPPHRPHVRQDLCTLDGAGARAEGGPPGDRDRGRAKRNSGAGALATGVWTHRCVTSLAPTEPDQGLIPSLCLSLIPSPPVAGASSGLNVTSLCGWIGVILLSLCYPATGAGVNVDHVPGPYRSKLEEVLLNREIERERVYTFPATQG